MLFQDKYFRKAQWKACHGWWKWIPQNIKDKGLAQAQKLKTLHFTFSDPRSHWVHRKSQYYQEGVRCCFMSFLLKVLSDMLQNPQPLSHIHICPKPKCQTRPHRLCLSGATEFHHIQPLPNPSHFGLIDGISVSPRWACKFSVIYCNIFGLTKFVQSVPPSLLDQFSVYLLPKSVSPSLSNRSNRVEVLP